MIKKLEVACFNLRSAFTAMAAGADRIEFCADYSVGGLSPSINELKILKTMGNTPVYVMIRPRAGDFVYSEEEIQRMLKSINAFKLHGADGFVFGALTAENTIDIPANQQLVHAASPLPCTFHRAFDRCRDPFAALEDIIGLGIQNILSSGGQNTALQGAGLLNKLKAAADKKVSFVAGGGVRSGNITPLTNAFDTEFYHSSGITDTTEFADQEELKRLRKALNP
jgi:copper homeostasis protein